MITGLNTTRDLMASPFGNFNLFLKVTCGVQFPLITRDDPINVTLYCCSKKVETDTQFLVLADKPSQGVYNGTWDPSIGCPLVGENGVQSFLGSKGCKISIFQNAVDC